MSPVPDEQKLSPEIKAKWVEALRSGKYEQGKHELLNERGAYCCLGVLAHVMGVADIEREPSLDELHLDVLGPWDRPGDEDFDTDNPETWTTDQRHLAGMNDSGCTFAEIADYIEANL